MKNWLKNVIYTVTLCALILMMLFFNATSPYQLWDISLKLIDYDKLEVLRTFWMLAISFGYGSDFYIVPYMYVTLGLFIDGLLNNKQGQ